MLQPMLDGLVLVGGKSSRMQRPKAYLDFGRGAQWQACGTVLSSVCHEVYYSVSAQLEPKLPLQSHLIADIFTEPIGPLGALLSAFDYAPGSSYFVVSCDAPHFDEEAASYLQKARNPHKKATVFESQGLIEPLLAIYEPAIFVELANAWALKKRCMRQIVTELDIERVACPHEKWLMNVNHHDEYQAYKQGQKSKTVTVHFYASLREHMKQSSASITTQATSVGELYQELEKRYGFALAGEFMRYAHNHQLVDAEHEFFDRDEIVFIPPVSGG